MDKDAWHQDDEQNIRYFTNLAAKYGASVRALDWGSRESQQLRFAILAQVGELNGTSVLDVGCGLGDFFNWLKQTGIKAEYTGIDITPRMIEIARQRFPETRFVVRNLLDVEDGEICLYDFVFASGIFTHRHHSPFLFLKAMVSEMFAHCSKAVAVNSLSSWAPNKEPAEFHADPLEVVAFCRTLTPWVVLRHDYHPRDFTIYMYREPNT